MDVDRLKSGGSVVTQELFDRQLEKVRETRLSERKFYQKITDIYATSVDYDATAAATQRFFAAVQNKLHYAAHGQTAAEVIVERADAEQPHMGLLSTLLPSWTSKRPRAPAGLEARGRARRRRRLHRREHRPPRVSPQEV